LVSEATDRALAQEPGLEEKAIISLAGNRVADACGHLLAAGNFRLATLVSSIGMQNKDIKAQLKDWRESNVLAEFSEPIRAIYELLAGNACVCAGVKGVPIENRVDSFTISQRFGLDWMQSFGLRLFYSTGATPNVAEAVRSFQSDIEQDKEPEPDSALWSLLKAFANREFDWSDPRLGWLMTKAIYATGKVSFGEDAAEKLDKASLSFASALTAQSHWVPATFVLLQLSDSASREAAVRDHLGRHAHRIGAARNPASAFAALRKFGVPEPWIWEAKALDFRSRGDAQREFLALVWAQNYAEANQAFVHRVGPDLVIQRDMKRLFAFAQLLFKVKSKLQGWEREAAVYLLYPMARVQGRGKGQGLDRFDNMLLDGLVALKGKTGGDIRQEAAIADMAEELIRCRGGDPRLYQLLPQDVRGRYMRAQALENIR
jgi:nuclear pore complex protein Nup98-Nup96